MSKKYLYYYQGLITIILMSSLFIPSVKAEISYDFSGFGTLGYAISDQPFKYVQHIDNEGSFAKDSLIAGQLDIKFNPKFSATIQAKLAADNSQENGVEPSITWAFLSYRPNNDWLIRLGKLQIPGYLNSVNRDLGISYDYARLPSEFDSISPVYNFIGASINKTFTLTDSEIIVDAYAGKTKASYRYYIGESIEDIITQGADYYKVDVEVIGASITYKTTDNVYLAGLHRARIKKRNGDSWDANVGYFEKTPSIGYYSTDEDSGILTVDSFDLYIANIGADIYLGDGFRLASELAVRNSDDLETGLNSISGYVSLKKKINNWTPYIFYSQIKTNSADLKKHSQINNNQVPEFIPFSNNINASQHVIADSFEAFDQFSIAIGTSYQFTPINILKAEIMMVQVNKSSSLFDIPSGNASQDYSATVFSISYSFAF
ncbi:hypothetical protein [uncultured Psychromonas sp.]|uniref:hypothetical protein n=1 Tax=uncultured Psychromonas sp. TaxID=173974 RepID=UPI00262BFBF4|nr:hypothetical protein [uncultured Psychromonas sp.]